MTKKEKKLLKASKKLEKATKKYMEALTEVDEVFQNLPMNIARRYELEERYFKHIPPLASAAVKMELFTAYIKGSLGVSEIPAQDPWLDMLDFDEEPF